MRKNTEKGRVLVTDATATGKQPMPNQAISIPHKVALWAAVVGGIASLGGNITLLLLTNSPSLNSIIILLCWLASIATLAAKKAQWTRLVSTILGIVILYLLLSTPYVIEHLSNPNAPDGGIGTFIGDVLVIVCALLVFGGSLMALLPKNRVATSQ